MRTKRRRDLRRTARVRHGLTTRWAGFGDFTQRSTAILLH
jgi:hypothetical protein